MFLKYFSNKLCSLCSPKSYHSISSIGVTLSLILTEEISQLIEEEVIDWQKKGDFPLIVEVPGIHGHVAGKKSLTDSIREAVGIQI